MDDRLAAHDSDEIQWTEMTSKNGKTFRVGTRETKPSTETQSAVTNELPDSELANRCDVVWPVGNSLWKTTSQQAANAGIRRYALYRLQGGSYKYCLDFTNTKGWMFWFWDKSGDHYEVATYVNRDHWVDYNSDDPDIKQFWY